MTLQCMRRLVQCKYLMIIVTHLYFLLLESTRLIEWNILFATVKNGLITSLFGCNFLAFIDYTFTEFISSICFINNDIFNMTYATAAVSKFHFYDKCRRCNNLALAYVFNN